MVQLSIRCHPRAPVSTDELEQWLEQHVTDLRTEAPHATVRLSRLTQGMPSSELKIGWLVELELADGERFLTEERVANALRDMRLLGLEPTLLRPTSSATPRPAASPRAADANGAGS